MFYIEYTINYLKNKLKTIKKNSRKCKITKYLYIMRINL